jgi:hypothetical protein
LIEPTAQRVPELIVVDVFLLSVDWPNVRFGSKADVFAGLARCPLSANSGRITAAHRRRERSFDNRKQCGVRWSWSALCHERTLVSLFNLAISTLGTISPIQITGWI